MAKVNVFAWIGYGGQWCDLRKPEKELDFHFNSRIRIKVELRMDGTANAIILSSHTQTKPISDSDYKVQTTHSALCGDFQ